MDKTKKLMKNIRQRIYGKNEHKRRDKRIPIVSSLRAQLDVKNERRIPKTAKLCFTKKTIEHSAPQQIS